MLVAFPIQLREPIEESIVAPHFGRVSHYALYDTESEDLRIIRNESNHFGGTLLPPHFLHSKGVQMIVAKLMGPSAYQNMLRLGIKVMTTPEDINVLKDVLAHKDYWVEVDEDSPVVEKPHEQQHLHRHDH